MIQGKLHCAKQTQEKFICLSPVFSQVTSLIQFANGDNQGAKKTQEEFYDKMKDLSDKTPINLL